MEDLLTIGQLAKRVSVRTSTLRYYEQEGLLMPESRTEAGYRLYANDAVDKVHLIQRGQRLGFSLADMAPLLQEWELGNLSDEAIVATAESRYVALEKQITRLLIMQHELQLFLQDLKRGDRSNGSDPNAAFDQLLARICANPANQASANTIFDWLIQYGGCSLTSQKGQEILDKLRGQHVHIWQEEEAYHILVVSHDERVAQALQDLAQLEGHCQAHAHAMPQLTYGDEGYLFVAGGDNAFIFARLFLALEGEGH